MARRAGLLVPVELGERMEDEAAVGLLGGGRDRVGAHRRRLLAAVFDSRTVVRRRVMPQAKPPLAAHVKARPAALSHGWNTTVFSSVISSTADARALLADPAALETAVGHRVRAPERRRVDLDRAAVDLGGEAQGAVEVGREQPGPEPVVAVVRERDRLVDPDTGVSATAGPNSSPAGDLERRVDVAERCSARQRHRPARRR